MEEFISRMGRSLYTCIIYNGHSTKDLPTEGIKNSITYKFVFRSRNNREEAARLLDYLGLEVTPENMLVIQNLGAGQCLFKDLYNRVGVLQFDPVFRIYLISFLLRQQKMPMKNRNRRHRNRRHQNRRHQNRRYRNLRHQSYQRIKSFQNQSHY